MTDLQLLLVSTLLTAGSAISTVSGGGLGILTVVASSFFFDIRTAITLTSTLMLGIQVAKAVAFFRDIHWGVARWYILSGIPASYLGGSLLFLVPERVPEIGLGLSCLGYVVLRLRQSKATKLQPTRATLLLYGALNGSIGGLVGNASLVRMPGLLSMGLTRHAFIATSSMIGLLMNTAKTSAYLQNIAWQEGFTVLLAIGFPSLFVGVYLGKYLLRYVSEDLFERLLLGIIAIGALRLLLG